MKRKGCIFFIVLFLLLYAGYKIYQNFNFRVWYIQPLDKSQCITLFRGFESYIVPGKHFLLPSDKNYIKLDLKTVSSMNDIISVCWNDSVGWNMVIPEASLIINNLDSVFFVFLTHFPRIPENSNFKECGFFDQVTAYYNEALTPGTGSRNIYYEYGKTVWIWKK